MKIIKKSVRNNRQARTVSETFNSVIGNLSLEKFFDSIELNLGEEEDFYISKRNARIMLNHDNLFIKNTDRKGIKVLILHQIFHAITRQYLKKMPHIIEDVIINKDLIKRGYGDDLLYFYYSNLITHPKNIKDIEDFMDINTPWISFFSLDNYNSSFLKKLTTRFDNTKKFEIKSKKLFLAMRKDLMKERNQKIAINAYKTILKECEKCR